MGFQFDNINSVYNMEEASLESENLTFLDDLDSCIDEIKCRLAISKMVNDSIMKGVVSAIEQDAADEVAKKEFEIGKLKEAVDEPKYTALSAAINDKFSEYCDTFRKLNEEIEKVKASVSGRSKIAKPELLGLGTVLAEREHNWKDVDKALEALKDTVESLFKYVDNVFAIKSSPCQQEGQVRLEIEKSVTKTCVSGAQDEYEKRLLANLAAHGSGGVNNIHNLKKIASLKEELEAVYNSFISENEQPLSFGFLENSNDSSCYVPVKTSLWEENGMHDPSVITLPEKLDLAQLKHLRKDELGNYLKVEMMKMKRYFEKKIQEMTEEIFSLKRDYLKGRTSALPAWRHKDSDLFYDRMPEIFGKLRDILVESEKWAALNFNKLNLSNFINRLNSLNTENFELKKILEDKDNDVLLLSSKVSDLIRLVNDAKQDKEDADTETLISNNLFKFLAKAAVSQFKCLEKASVLDCDDFHELFEFQDCDSELMARGLREVVLKEALNNAEEMLKQISSDLDTEIDHRSSLEVELMEKEKHFKLISLEVEDLKHEMRTLASSLHVQEELAKDALNALKEDKTKHDAALVEIIGEKIQVESMFKQCEKEMQITSGKLVEAVRESRDNMIEASQLREKLVSTEKQVNKAIHENKNLLSVIKQQAFISSMHEKDEKLWRTQMNIVSQTINELCVRMYDFEHSAVESITTNCLRLEKIINSSNSLFMEANACKKSGTMYKQRLERKVSDLQKAEAEVDLLGDEVDTLLNLLEKIYIALNHYAPVLQHYPGIIEILKLVRRELCGDTIPHV